MVMVNSKQSTFTSPAIRSTPGFSAAVSRKSVSPGVSPSKKWPLWLAWNRRNGRPSKPVTYLMMRPNSSPWPALSSAIMTRSFGWPSSAREPGACKLSCRRPRTSGGTGGEYS